MTAHVYAPAAGVTIRLKAEDSNDPTKSVETDVVTTTSVSGWNPLIFDFAKIKLLVLHKLTLHIHMICCPFSMILVMQVQEIYTI